MKAVIVIEVDIEKDTFDLPGEVCRRITMHPNVKNAKVLATSRMLYADEPPEPND